MMQFTLRSAVRFSICVLVGAALSHAARSAERPVPVAGPAVGAGNAAYRDAKLPIEQRVKDLLGRMTLEEKIEQLTQKDASGIVIQGNEADPASLEKLFHDRSPGVLCAHFGDDLHQSAVRLAAGQRYLRERTRLGIPALTVNEGLHGVLAQGATIYPQFLALGCSWNPALAEQMGSQIAEEATAAGINHLLTPMIEVVRDPRWGRVEECIGESPFLVGRMCSAYTLGIQGDLRTKPLATKKALAMLKTFAPTACRLTASILPTAF